MSLFFVLNECEESQSAFMRGFIDDEERSMVEELAILAVSIRVHARLHR